MKNSLIFLLFGFFSGVISFVSFKLFNDYAIAPGVVFATSILVYFFFLCEIKKSFLWRGLAWVMFSTVANYTASIIVYDYFFRIDKSVPPIPTEYKHMSVFIFAGAMGAFLMLVGFHYLLQKMSLTHFILLVCMGGLLSMGWFLGDFNSKHLTESPFLYLYIIWQTGMAFGLGYALDRNQKTEI